MTGSDRHWAAATVGTVLKIRYGKALEKAERDPDGPVPVIGSAGRMTGTHTPLVAGPAVLIGRKGNAGAIQIEEGGCWPIDTTYYASIPDGVDGRFLRWQLHSLNLGRLDSSTTTPSLRREDLEAQPLRIPSLDEQHRIVNLLEDHLSRLDAANHMVERARSSGAALVRASLQAGLRGELVEDDLSDGTAADIIGKTVAFTPGSDDRLWPVPESWAWVRLGELFQINVGSTPSRARNELWSGELAWVSSGEVSFGRITATKEHITREAAGNPLTRIQPPGTVMLAMIGEGKTRGQAAILEVEAAHNQNCASIRVASTPVLPEYIFGYLQERYLETRRGGSGGQQQALNKSAIQHFPVPIAPLGTQRRLVAAWTETREAGERLDHDLHSAGQRSERLRRSLLVAAFSGRLTGQPDLSEVAEMIPA